MCPGLAARWGAGVHQYAARTWTLKTLLEAGDRHELTAPLHLEDPEELLTPARRAGFRVAEVHLLRSVRFYPFAIPVPSWLPGRIWRHCVAVFRRAR